MTPVLTLFDINKYFPGGLKTLDSINLFVQKGEFVSIIGPSGCGKTTLFNIIAGIEKQTSGTVEINGKISAIRTGKFGYMMQEPYLLPWRTALENITLGAEIKGLNRKNSEREAKELLHKFHLDQFENHYPDTLSGGMKQRVALLRTILFHQEFLLLDEPFGALDALTRISAQFWLMQVWNKFHSSVLFITHDVREAILLSDKIIVLSNRPAKIIETVKINLPRPRNTNQLSQSKIVKLEKELINLLIGEQSRVSPLINYKAGDAREGSHTEMYRSMGYSSGRTRIKIKRNS